MTGSRAAGVQYSGPIPDIYDKYLVPLIFEPYAIDLAQRAAALPITNVLELAAGTGVVTRRLAMTLPGSVFIIATDLSQPMLDHAASVGIRERACDVGENAKRFRDRQRPGPPQALSQRLPLHVRHRVPEHPRPGAGVVHREDLRVLQLRRDADLSLEALSADGRRGVRMEHLHGDRAVVSQILGEVHGRHAAPAELALERVAVRESCAKALRDVHGTASYCRDSDCARSRLIRPQLG